ncbi:MAG: phosphoserine phosphatase SerB [Nitratireductor sp.]
MSLVATLIANPQTKALSDTLIDSAKNALKANSTNWLSMNEACDIILPENLSDADARATLEKVIGELPIDFANQNQQERKKKVLIADMDSTMIDQECIDELAAEVGVKERVSQITAKAMNGEIEFDSALRERVALLKGLPEGIYQQVIDNRITLAKGGKQLVATMKANGGYCALVSGGFTLFTRPIGEEIGFDENRANVLLTSDGKLDGLVQEPILGAQAKVEALNDIANTKGLSAADFIAVGDGANDLPMLKLAGTGVALHAKPAVGAQSKIKINHGDLTSLLYLQGYTKSEFAL